MLLCSWSFLAAYLGHISWRCPKINFNNLGITYDSLRFYLREIRFIIPNSSVHKRHPVLPLHARADRIHHHPSPQPIHPSSYLSIPRLQVQNSPPHKNPQRPQSHQEGPKHLTFVSASSHSDMRSCSKTQINRPIDQNMPLQPPVAPKLRNVNATHGVMHECP